MNTNLENCQCYATLNHEIQYNFQFPDHQAAVEFIQSPDREPGLWGVMIESYVEVKKVKEL